MMTVREHAKAAGYDPTLAWNADMLWPEEGTMECGKVEIRTFSCLPSRYDGEMLGVEVIAVVPFTDGYEHPLYFGGGIEARITLYFPLQ